VRSWLWGTLFVVCLVAGPWSFFAAMMSEALAAGPTTPEDLAAIRLLADRLLAGSATFGTLAVLSLIRLSTCLRRRDA
jgi:hypothetical protein